MVWLEHSERGGAELRALVISLDGWEAIEGIGAEQ